MAWRMVTLNVNFLSSFSRSLAGLRVDMNCGRVGKWRENRERVRVRVRGGQMSDRGKERYNEEQGGKNKRC